MTVNYMRKVATVRVGTFLALLFRWRGSVWKSVWFELCIWLFLCLNIGVVYQFFLRGTPAGEQFEELVRQCRNLEMQTSNVFVFALAFYVVQISARWWTVFMMIPWPDEFATSICAYIQPRGKEHDDEDLKARKSILRYMSLTYTLVFRGISERIRKRFPTYNHLVPSLMTAEECTRVENADEERKLWLPIEWTINILKKFRQHKQVEEYHYVKMIESLLNYRERLHNVLQYDWVNVPLVYTQVVNVIIQSYFILQSVSAQPIDFPEMEEESWLHHFPIPVFSVFKFIVFVGWLKVAQVMINPFGMDDDDFEIDVIIERNLTVSYSIVDNMYERAPKLVDLTVKTLPHTTASAALMMKETGNPMKGSAAGVEVDEEEQKIISPKVLSQLLRLDRKPLPVETKSPASQLFSPREPTPSGRKNKTPSVSSDQLITPEVQASKIQKLSTRTQQRSRQSRQVPAPPPSQGDKGKESEATGNESKLGIELADKLKRLVEKKDNRWDREVDIDEMATQREDESQRLPSQDTTPDGTNPKNSERPTATELTQYASSLHSGVGNVQRNAGVRTSRMGSRAPSRNASYRTAPGGQADGRTKSTQATAQTTIGLIPDVPSEKESKRSRPLQKDTTKEGDGKKAAPSTKDAKSQRK